MPAPVRVKIVGVTSFVVELVHKTQRQGADHFCCQSDKKIFAVNIIGYPRPYNVCQRIDDEEYDRGHYEIAELQGES